MSRLPCLALLFLLPFVVAPGLLAQEDGDLGASVRRVVARMDKAEGAELWRLSRDLRAMGPEALPIVSGILPELSSRQKLAVSEALIDLGETRVGSETLLALAGPSEPADIRVQAIDLLGRKAGDEVAERLAPLLTDCFDSGVRIALSKALWLLTSELSAKEELKAVLRSTDPETRI
ncbi:MAG: hypothetical protein MUE73_09990, partial [Planctomycetes bacterium]|nr:hypothetical protein [Planctomycetota bacterium]